MRRRSFARNHGRGLDIDGPVRQPGRCSQSVTVRLAAAHHPLPGNILLTTDPGRCSRSNVTYTVTSGDNCSGLLILAAIPADPRSEGATTNCSGRRLQHHKFCSFTVTIVDNEPPHHLPTPGHRRHPAGAELRGECSAGTPTVSDNAVASVSITRRRTFPQAPTS
jgi:hypothetical protein